MGHLGKEEIYEPGIPSSRGYGGVHFLRGAFTLGCTTVVPVSPIGADEGHGLLFGNMQLVWNETEDSEGFKQPVDMKWWIEEETQGKRYLTAYIPTQGPFTLKLPAGSYRVREISFYSRRGIWHSALPTTFQIQPRGLS
jgi:hypothetical protein